MEENVKSLVEARMPTKFGDFKLIAFPGDSKDKDDITGGGAIAIPKGWIKKIEYLKVEYATQ